MVDRASKEADATPSPAWLGTVPPTRAETHFDGRVVRCFADRPRSAYALLEDALARNPRWRGHRLRRCAPHLRGLRSAGGAIVPAGLAKRWDRARRPGGAAARQRRRLSRGPVRRLAAGRDRASRSASGSRRRALPTCSRTAAPRRWCTTPISPTGCPPRMRTPALAHRIARGSRRRAAGSTTARRRRARDRVRRRVDEEDTAVILYTSGHHRPAQGRHADPSRHLPLGPALRVLHGARRSRPGRGRRADEPRHRRDRPDRRHGPRGRHAHRHARVQGGRVHRAGRARAHDAHAAGAGDVQSLPARAALRGGRSRPPGASAASAARRCRPPPSSAWRAEAAAAAAA